LIKTAKKKIRCIVCPEGCSMQAEYETDSKKIFSLSGQNCKRGIKFAEAEITNPLRMLTTTISIDSRISQRLPVRSNVPAPKEKIASMVKAVKQIRAKAPIKMGEIIMANILGTGVDIISSATVEGLFEGPKSKF
jgi:CxxC motif-containing protein